MATNHQIQLIKTVRESFGAEVNFPISEQGNKQVEVINPNNGGAWITVEKRNWDYEKLSAFHAQRNLETDRAAVVNSEGKIPV
jgi:hypothetical protein